MNILLWLILITSISGVAGTGLGGVVGAAFRKDSSKTVSLLLSFAAGVMLSVVCFDLIADGLQQLQGQPEGIWLVVVGILAGYGVVQILNNLIDRKTDREVPHIDASHPKTADNLDELIHSNHLRSHAQRQDSSYQLFLAGVVMACAIALHNMPEGMVIGAAFAADGADVFSRSGLVLAVIIGLHNIPEGMAVSVPLIAGGMGRGKAILITGTFWCAYYTWGFIGVLVGDDWPGFSVFSA